MTSEASTIVPFYSLRDFLKDKGPAAQWSFERVVFPDEGSHCASWHWVPSSSSGAAYPFAAYNRGLSVVRYQDDEYKDLPADGWTREQTDHLFDLCQVLELRWPVIADRYRLIPYRTAEECRQRFFSVMKVLLDRRRDRGVLRPEEQEFRFDYNYKYELKRRAHLDRMFRVSKLEERKISDLHEELERTEQQMRQFEQEDKEQSSDCVLGPKEAQAIEEEMASQSRVHVPVGASLRSSRFEISSGKSGPTVQILRGAQAFLSESGLPPKMMATSVICDAYDRLRHDAIKLMILQKQVALKDSYQAQLESASLENKKRKAPSDKLPKKKKIKS